MTRNQVYHFLCTRCTMSLCATEPSEPC